VYYADVILMSWISLTSSTVGYTNITPLVPGITYAIKIVAVNKYGNSLDSTTINVVAG